MSDSNTQDAVNRREALRAKAQEIMKDKVLKPAVLGFICDDYRLLKRKDDKPPTLVVDAYPLKNPNDVGSADFRFKRPIWVPLIGADDWIPDDPQQRDQAIRTMAAIFPEHVPAIERTPEGYFFNGSKMAYKDAQTEQALYAMDTAEQVWSGALNPKPDQFFWAIVTLNDDQTRNWVNPVTYAPEQGPGVPEEFEG